MHDQPPKSLSLSLILSMYKLFFSLQENCKKKKKQFMWCKNTKELTNKISKKHLRRKKSTSIWIGLTCFFFFFFLFFVFDKKFVLCFFLEVEEWWMNKMKCEIKREIERESWDGVVLLEQKENAVVCAFTRVVGPSYCHVTFSLSLRTWLSSYGRYFHWSIQNISSLFFCLIKKISVILSPSHFLILW